MLPGRFLAEARRCRDRRVFLQDSGPRIAIKFRIPPLLLRAPLRLRASARTFLNYFNSRQKKAGMLAHAGCGTNEMQY